MNTITFLPLDHMKVLKQIIIRDSSNVNEFTLGYILFERMLTPDYKFKETPQEEKDIRYYMEYPRQDDFPNDRLDDIILQAIKNMFPKSVIRNHPILTNIDEDNVKIMKNRLVEKSQLTFTPNFSNIDLATISGRNYDYLRKNIFIYNNYRKEKIQNIYFTGYYDISDHNILDEFDKINFI